MNNFNVSINRLLGLEGGYVNNPKDPGGETNWGISKRSYPTADIANLTRDQAISLYKRDFWDSLKLDDLPLGVSYQMLDFAVNSGISPCVRAIQRSVGTVPDGIIGEHTLAAIKSTDAHDIVMRFLAERLEWMSGCKNWPDAGRGWVRRIAKDLRFGATDT